MIKNSCEDEVNDTLFFELRCKKLERVLETIDSSENEISLMKYQKGMSVKAISEILELGDSTVKSV